MAADPARWLALLAALAAATRLGRIRPRTTRWLAPLLAAALSAFYIYYYLRSGPRIIDATAYLLQARALAEGFFAWPLPEPEHAVLGRFLLRTSVDGIPAVSVIFPPGYPAALAIAVKLGAPLALGPLVAALLVVATAELAREVALRLGRETTPVWLLASQLSVVCAALRYHTADTMSHGWAALLTTATLALALRVERQEHTSLQLMTGLLLGWLLATRPVSAIAAAVVVAWLWLGRRAPPSVAERDHRRWLWLGLGIVPGLMLWGCHQHAATGQWWGMAQSSYYALSDGPPGCFGYGFGEGIGCLGEHGAFVRQRMPDGYGLRAALLTTGRRLLLHSSDVLNASPLVLVVLAGMWHVARAGLTAVAALPLLQLVAYAPFYFDGNYPGGGARMLAEAIPTEHVLVAVAWLGWPRLNRLASRQRGPLLVALMLTGFALQTAGHHQHLRDREGGKPMFARADLPATELAAQPRSPTQRTPQLLFVTSDHAFNLAHLANPGIAVRRHRGDALDWLTWDRQGRPESSWLHHFDFHGDGGTTMQRLRFGVRAPTTARIEGESLWPPRQQHGGWAWPSHGPKCLSRRRGLRFTPQRKRASVQLALPAKLAAGRELTVFFHGGGQTAEVVIRQSEQVIARLPLSPNRNSQDGCHQSRSAMIPAKAAKLTLTLRSSTALWLDRLELRAPPFTSAGR